VRSLVRRSSVAARARAHLVHGALEFRFYLLDPSQPAPGHRWWMRKLGPLIRATPLEAVAQSVRCVELFPYHSKRFGHAKLRVPIHHNDSERSVRPVAVGRKSWLFAGSERGGQATAFAYSLIQRCKLASVDPYAYLRDVLIRVATHPASRVGELTPANRKRLFAHHAARWLGRGADAARTAERDADEPPLRFTAGRLYSSVA